MYRLFILLILIFSSTQFTSYAQDLEALLDNELTSEDDDSFVTSTFKSTRLINGHTIKSPAQGDLLMIISHRFGEINLGIEELFGLDVSTIRIGFEYGLSKRLTIGTGRSSFNKTIDNYLKYKLIHQKSNNGSPVSISLLASNAIMTKKWANPELDYSFKHRLSYTSQLLIARKFTSDLSIQLSPGYLHRNLVEFAKDPNDIIYLGFGGRYKLSKRFSLNAEYHYIFSDRIQETRKNPLSFGIDIDTGGHVFHLMLSNSRGMTDAAIIPETAGSWKNGDIHFGFSIVRTF